MAEINLWEAKKKETTSKIEEYKLPVEANIVACFYKQPDLLYDYSDLKITDFSNNDWRVYFAIIHGLFIIEKKEVITALTIGVYLEKHLKLQKEYDSCGGFETVDKIVGLINVENLNGYILELEKWNVLLEMTNNGFPVWENLKRYNDMSLEDIYDENEARLNNIFIKRDGGVSVHDISEGIDDLIDKMNEGQFVGLEFNQMPLLTELTGGCLMGDITAICSPSNTGKSSFIRNVHLMSLLNHKERVVCLINEESLAKWQREMLCWICNNILKIDLQKYIIRNGKYSAEVKSALTKAADWLKEKSKSKMITIIPLKQYSTDKAIKIIKKYSSLGVKYFVLDTYKNDIDIRNEKRWENLKQNAVKLYDCIKPEGKNVHLFLSMQVALSDKRQRYLDLDNIAEAKGAIEPMASVLMMRWLFPDEYPNQKNAIEVRNLVNGVDTLVPLDSSDSNKRYVIIFLAKLREGESGNRQVVCQMDLSRNTLKEIGWTKIPFTSF